MKRIIAVALGSVILPLALAGAWAGVDVEMEEKDEGRPSNLVSIGGSAQLEEGRTVADMVVIGGSAVARGNVEGDMVVIGGTADVDCPVGKDLVVLGSARLGPKAVIGKDLVVIGGDLDADPLAVVKKDKTVISAGVARRPLFGLWGWVREGLFKARPVAPLLWWTWALGLLFGLLYVLIAAGAPAVVEPCAEALAQRPLTALLAGVLGLSGLAPFAFLLVVSIIGVAAIPLLFFAALATILVGKAAVCFFIGKNLARMGRAPALERPALAAAAGAAALLALLMVPIAGFGVWALTTIFGFGAALLAGVDALKAERALAEAPAPAAPQAAEASAEAALPRAGFWLRLAAIVLDGFAFLVLGAVTHLIALGLGGWAVYQVGMWAWKGTTLGGMIVGIKGLRLDGRPMDVPVALVRHLASYLSALPMFLGFFWAGWDPEKQAWHDKIAGTIVVRVPNNQTSS